MNLRDLEIMKRIGHPARAAALAGKPFLARIAPKAKDKAPDGEVVCGEIFLYDAIGSGFWGNIDAKSIVDAIKTLKADGATALNIYINSPGGDVFEATAIYNEIARFNGKKTCYIDGLAASAASYIAMVGDEIVTAFNAMWMIHNPWGMCVGNENDFRKTADDLHKIGSTLLATYVKRTGQPAADVQAWLDAETWMTAQEAKDRGFTNTVTGGGCSCATCGPDCPCKGKCGPDCTCPCDEEDDASASASPRKPGETGLLARYKNTPAALKPSGRDMIASMQQRLDNLPTRASPLRPIPGKPGKQ